MKRSAPFSKPARVPLAALLSRVGWKALGCVALGIGALGVVLPLLPTTPLVILATMAFAKSSPALHGWLLQNRTFGPIIADWQAQGVIAPRYKALALSMMIGALGLSVALMVPVFVLIVQIASMLLAAAFILSRPGRVLPT
ncbi:YbaN family protein [Aliiroseovarius sp. PTFE2010]|uniref:YbaN family protein n=1 Tax=Aliiroseovarius sp. PTFE2010 TaxID=3417190 RepID=UPI003CE70E57